MKLSGSLGQQGFGTSSTRTDVSCPHGAASLEPSEWSVRELVHASAAPSEPGNTAFGSGEFHLKLHARVMLKAREDSLWRRDEKSVCWWDTSWDTVSSEPLEAFPVLDGEDMHQNGCPPPTSGSQQRRKVTACVCLCLCVAGVFQKNV